MNLKPEKLKILCLHGWATNPQFMEYQMKDFIASFPNCEFQFIQGPYDVPESFITDEKVIKLIPDKRFYGWKFNVASNLFNKFQTGFEGSVNTVCDFINKNGPVDGILGFSQGTVVVQFFFDELERGLLKDKLKQSPPKFAILVSGASFISNSEKRFFTTPSIHLIGKKDFLFHGGMLATLDMIEKINLILKPILHEKKKAKENAIKKIKPKL